MAELHTTEAIRADLMFPLHLFYARVNHLMPAYERLMGEQVPQPQRRLLVHDGDMTPTLEAFHGGPIGLRVLEQYDDGEGYFRQVVLLRERDGAVVEYGAIRIVLARFKPGVQQMIREGRVPLGNVLARHTVAHRSRPRGYFRVRCDAWISAALGLGGEAPPALYGRRNVIVNHADQPLADVVEILPPASAGEGVQP